MSLSDCSIQRLNRVLSSAFEAEQDDIKARFAQQFREQIRKSTRAAHRQQFLAGSVVGVVRYSGTRTCGFGRTKPDARFTSPRQPWFGTSISGSPQAMAFEPLPLP